MDNRERFRISRRLPALLAAFLLAASVTEMADAQGDISPSATTILSEEDFNPTARQMGLVESAMPVRDMIKNWRKPEKIVVFVDDNPRRIAWLQEVAPGVKLVAATTRAEGLKEIVDADAQLGGSCSKELVRAGRALRWVHDNHAGVDACFGGDAPEKLKNGTVLVSNLQRVLGTIIADHVMAMILALSRDLDVYIRMNKDGHFDTDAIPRKRLWEIQGRTMLVAGLGGVGTDVAKLAHSIGMKVIATRATNRSRPDFVEYVGLADELPSLIGKADVVVSTLPLTAETTGLFNAGMFSRMKKGALFINVARGSEVVTADLISALKSGQVGGAGLDVTDPEQLPDNDPLFRAPNIIISPHMAAKAVDADDASGGETTWRLARENLKRYVAGDKLYSVVDPKRGY